jgi:hypothetical protein
MMVYLAGDARDPVSTQFPETKKKTFTPKIEIFSLGKKAHVK